MKTNTPPSYKLPLVYVAICAVLVALGQSASAAPHPLPPGPTCMVPDGGTTIMLLGAAVGGLGIARRFLKR
jgi:protein with PEP-CTERM/exosortase system signal